MPHFQFEYPIFLQYVYLYFFPAFHITLLAADSIAQAFRFG